MMPRIGDISRNIETGRLFMVLRYHDDNTVLLANFDENPSITRKVSHYDKMYHFIGNVIDMVELLIQEKRVKRMLRGGENDA